MKNTVQDLYALEQLSGGDSCVHRLHSSVKLFTTVVFIITVVSFDRYAFSRLMPYIFYPALLMALSQTPYPTLLKRFLIALPFCFFAGISNILFDRTPAFAVGAITVSYGVVSFFTILFRTYLCVMAVLLLVAVTPFAQITNSMRRLKTPYIFIVMFEMTYRYIGVLVTEAYSMFTAYSLRSAGGKGIAMKDMGSFTGQLLLRSFDRADRVYNAMKCKGYSSSYALNTWESLKTSVFRDFPIKNARFTAHRARNCKGTFKNNRFLEVPTFHYSGGKLKSKDFIFCFVTCLLCITFRVINVNALFAEIIAGLA